MRYEHQEPHFVYPLLLQDLLYILELVLKEIEKQVKYKYWKELDEMVSA